MDPFACHMRSNKAKHSSQAKWTQERHAVVYLVFLRFRSFRFVWGRGRGPRTLFGQA